MATPLVVIIRELPTSANLAQVMVVSSESVAAHIKEKESRDVMDPKTQGIPPIHAIVQIEARRPEYRQNLRRLVSAHAALQDLRKRRAEEIERYERMRRKRGDADQRIAGEADRTRTLRQVLV